jgi:hypothetical protein
MGPESSSYSKTACHKLTWVPPTVDSPLRDSNVSFAFIPTPESS